MTRTVNGTGHTGLCDPYRACVTRTVNGTGQTRIAEAVDELWGGALRYEEEL